MKKLYLVCKKNKSWLKNDLEEGIVRSYKTKEKAIRRKKFFETDSGINYKIIEVTLKELK